MEFRVKDAEGFRLIIQNIARFIRRANIEASHSGIRIRSIDPHDFCYVDVKLSKVFRDEPKADGGINLVLDFSRVPKIVPYLTSGNRLDLEVDSEGLTFHTYGDWRSSFKIPTIISQPLQISDLGNFIYQATITVPARRFVEEIRKASAVSHEAMLQLKDGTFYLLAEGENYSFSGTPMNATGLEIKSNVRDGISSHVILDYIKLLGTLIERAKTLKVDLARDAPLRLSFEIPVWGSFVFYISHRKRFHDKERKGLQTGESLPRVSMTRFPEYCAFLSTKGSGARVKELVLSQVETTGGDYTRLAKRLGFVTSREKELMLTEQGRHFVSLFSDHPDKAKRLLHLAALEILRPYRELNEIVLQRPMSQEEIMSSVNGKLAAEKSRPLDRQDLSTLLGIATWCGAVDRKVGLYYFGREWE